MKLWAILKTMTMMELKKWEHFIDFRFIWRGPYQDFDDDFSESLSVSKPKLIKRLCDQYYASIQEFDAHYLDGSAHYIVPALAGKPFGTSSWGDLEGEMLQYIRPSTFSQKIRSLEWAGLIFKLGKKGERVLVMPDEILPQVRQRFNLSMQLPEEDTLDFGKLVPEEELEGALQQIPEFSLREPSSYEVFELQLKKDTGKKGMLQIPTTNTFQDLHTALQDFAGWDDEHLHDFTVFLSEPESNQVTIDGLDPLGKPLNYPDPGEYREDQVQLGQILSLGNSVVRYNYDFRTRHTVLINVIRVVPRDTSEVYPKLARGKKITPS